MDAGAQENGTFDLLRGSCVKANKNPRVRGGDPDLPDIYVGEMLFATWGKIPKG